MDNKNNTKKKVIITILALILVAVGILFALKGCQKEEPVVHTHSYKINEEGTWICKEDNDILSNTDKPYVAILENNEPKDILAIDSLSKSKINLGNGTIYKDGNNIYYSGNNAQTIIIKTQKVDDKQKDKDNLVINAPNDTVYHYGSSTVISLDAVATNSFHEYGKVELITLTKARVVLENKSDVKEIYLDINDSNYSYETTIIALKENVELPRLTRDAVNLEEGEVKTLAIVQKLKDEVKTETNTETNEVIETVLEVQAGNDDYVKIENVRKSNDELIIEAFLSPNADENDKTQTQTQSTSTVTLEEAKEGSSHPASHNTFISKEEKVIEVVNRTETNEEQKQEETKPVVTPTKKEETKPEVTPTEEDTPSKPSHTHSYGNWYDLDDTYHAKKCSCGDTIKEAHEYDENGVCKKCEHQNKIYVAQVESTKYEDALTAFKVAKLDNKTVTILANCSVFADDLPDDVDFDLNGKTLSKTFYKKVASADGENIFVDFWDSWNMQGMKDANGNECPQYILVSDETLYRDKGVAESHSEAWVSAKYIVENYASYCSFYEIANEPVSVFDGNTTAFKYFANGNGSQTKPYIIENVDQFKNIGKLSDYSLVDSENYETMFEKKTNKLYYINVTAPLLDFSSVSGAIWQLTAASPYIEASGFNVNIDFNDCEIKGKSLTFGSTGKYMGETLYDPNFGISYAVGYYLGYVYDRAYSVTIKNANFTNCGVNAENGVSLTLDNCSFDCSSYTKIRSYQNKLSTAGAVNHIIKDCKFNNCYLEFGGGSGSSYEINTQFVNCEFTKETSGGYYSTVKYDSYTYGNLSFDGCKMTVNLGQNYNPIKIETNQSYIGEHSVSLTIKDTTINWTSAVGTYDSGERVPVSKGIATIIEQGTNSYIVNGTHVNYNGSAIDE